MKLDVPGGAHLCYCTNIHPGESLVEVMQNIERHLPRVKAEVCADAPFGVGLRLSARAARELAEGDALEQLRELLGRHDLYAFTMNGFPYGVFHGSRVKEDVYLPDWLDDERLRYTDELARLLARLLPEELDGSVSTVPGAFRPKVRDAREADAIARRLARHAATLFRIRDATGKRIELCLEPEPFCHLETPADAVRFFEQHVFAAPARKTLSQLTGLSDAEAEAFLHRHIGVCFDACHMAVEFESPDGAVDALGRAGIRIGKVQISAGLEARLVGERQRDARVLGALRRFADDVYLHQVVESKGEGGLERYLDLHEALEMAERSPAPRQWRIHFHVPIFSESLGPFLSTQPFLVELGRLFARRAVASHWEVETYTWDVLPEEYRRAEVSDAIVRELSWVKSRMAG